MIEVRNFEGIFSGNSTYREGGVTYSGFDGATFSHVLYGDERPEELVYLSPLENFVMHVVTDPIAYENTEITAGAFVTGTEYKIKSIGTTDFTLIGAINNLVGTVFTATDAGIGSGIALEQVLTPIASIGVGPYLTEPTVTVASTAIVADREYTILTPNDTDFTTIGAANSNVGTTFIASGPGTGTGTVSFNNITAGNASGIAGLVTLATPLLLNTDTLILSNDGNSSLSTHMYDMHSSDNANSKILFNTGLYTWDSAAIDNIGNVTLNTAKTASATLANEYDTSAMANVSDTSNIVYANILTTISSSINATDTFYVQGSTNIILDGEYTAAVVDKANNLIQVTSNRLTNANVAIAGNLKVGIKQQAVTTEYIAHQDLFGGDEYLRVLSDGSGSTTTVKEINSWDTEITVLDATKLPIPKPGIPGAAWLDSSERIEYLRVAGNKLSGITRGTRGTTIPNGPAYTYASATSYISDGETITLTDASNTITSGNYVAGNITSNTFTVTANVTSIVNANSNIIIAIDSNDVQETVLSITTHDATNTVTITLPRTNIATLSNTFIKHETGISVVSAGKADVFDASPIEGGTVGFEARDPQDANWLKADGTQRSITDITNRNTGSGSTIAAFLHGDSVSSVGFDSKGWSTVGWDSI
jgi:hypothetical protein